MTGTSTLAGHTGSDAPQPAEGGKLPPFLSAGGHAGQAVERDFRLGHVLAQALSILRRHAAPFLLLYVIAALLINVPVTFTNDDSPAADVVLAMGISQALYVVFNVFAGAAVVDVVIDDMRGRPVDMTKALRVALRRFFPALGATIAVVGLAILGFALIIVPAAIVVSMFFVVVPACVVEGLGPVQSMRRSAELTKGSRWRIFALWFAIVMAEIIVQMELDQAIRPFGYFALVLAPQVLWDMVVGAFAAVATAVVYRDLRVAKEGVDADQVATVFD
ncbi:MAG: hypothetical protein WBQ24_17685 [Xanthobacteraceae bacterium]